MNAARGNDQPENVTLKHSCLSLLRPRERDFCDSVSARAGCSGRIATLSGSVGRGDSRGTRMAKKKCPVPRDVLRAFCRARQLLPTCPDTKGEWHILRVLTNFVQEAGTSCPSGLPGVDLPCLLRLHTGGAETWKSSSAATTRRASCSSFPTSTSRFGRCQQECDMQSIAAQFFRQYSDLTALCCSPLNCRPSSKRLAGPRRLQRRHLTLIGVPHARGLCDIQTSWKN